MSEPLIIKNADSYNLDTREQLEADLKTHMYEFGGYCFNSREGHADNVDTFFDDFIGLLDRQAAITEWEVEHDLMLAGRMAVEVERKRIAELTAERDELREALDAYGLGQMYDLYKQKCKQVDDLKAKYNALLEDREKVWCDCNCCGWQEEREQMQRVIHTQAESLRKLEVELAMRDD